MKSHIKQTSRLLALIAGTVFAGSASAAVSVTNSTGAAFALPTSAVSVSYDIVNANSVLVIGLYIDVGSSAFSNVSYGGQAPTGVFSADRLKVYYFNNPTVDASAFTATSSATQASPNNGYFLYELGGVDLTAPVVSASGTSARSITTTAADTFVVDLFAFNNGGLPAVPAALSELFKRSEVDLNSAFGGGYLAAGDLTASLAGVHTLGWTPGPNGFGYSEVALGFTPSAIPEPGSFALLAGVAGLGATMIRRRRR